MTEEVQQDAFKGTRSDDYECVTQSQTSMLAFVQQRHSETETSSVELEEVSKAYSMVSDVPGLVQKGAGKDVRHIKELHGGRLPETMAAKAERGSIIKPAEDYRRGSVIGNQIAADKKASPYQKNIAKAGMRGSDKKVLSSRTVADMLSDRGINPYAVDQMDVDILIQFRIKSLTLVIIQCFGVLLISFVAERLHSYKHITDEDDRHDHKFLVLCVCMVSLGTMLGTAYIRHEYPWNYYAAAFFTLTVGISIGGFSGPMYFAADTPAEEEPTDAGNMKKGMPEYSPQFFVGFFILGLILFSLAAVVAPRVRPSSIPGKPDHIPLVMLAFGAALVTDVLSFAVWALTEYIMLSWHVIAMVALTISISWAGYEYARLCSRLSADEYFLPMILIWVDVFIVMLTIWFCCMALSEGRLAAEEASGADAFAAEGGDMEGEGDFVGETPMGDFGGGGDVLAGNGKISL